MECLEKHLFITISFQSLETIFKEMTEAHCVEYLKTSISFSEESACTCEELDQFI